TRDRGVGQRTGHVVTVALVAGVGRVAHPVEALALVVRDLPAGAVGLARRLDPDVGVDTRSGVRPRTLTEAGPGLVAPVTGVNPAVDTGLVDEVVHAGGVGGGPGRTVRTAPAVAGGVD